jgi:hypothetical protein
MKKATKAVLFMMVLTLAYVSAVIYVYADSYADSGYYSYRYVLYGADKYEGDIPPTEWYTMEQLGICDVTEYGNGSWLHIAVDLEKEPFPLQEETPIFLYKDTWYQVSPLWGTPGLSESTTQWQIPIGGVLGVGWVLTGALFLKLRKNQ